MNRKWLNIIAAIVLGTALLLTACGPAEPAEEEPVLIIGAIYGGPINDAGYNQAVHEGITAIGDNIANVEIIEAENVPDGAGATPYMQVMIDQGAELIFATAYNHYEPAYDLAALNPNVKFEWCGGGKDSTDNLGTFFGKPPDGWYLMGIAAGMMADDDNPATTEKFGFVAAYPLGWTRTFINAFTLGAQSVNDNVETHIAFTMDWADLALQAAATNSLINTSLVEVITMHIDAPQTVIVAAEALDTYSIGYQSLEAQKFAPDYWISGIGFTFGDKLTEVAQSVIDGTYVGKVKPWGWAEGAMALAPWGDLVGDDVKTAVATAQAELIALEEAGDASYVFEGPIYDRDTGELAVIYPFGSAIELSEGVVIPEAAWGWGDAFYVLGVIGDVPELPEWLQ